MHHRRRFGGCSASVGGFGDLGGEDSRETGFPRTDRQSEIAAHGFDINTEAVKLQEFYINAYEQNC